MIVLYDLAVAADRRPSPFCWRSKFALRHKGLDWQEVPVGFTEKDRIAFAGSTTLPVLRDTSQNDHAVRDSWAIAEYLEASYPQRPLFVGESGRTFARFINIWADFTVHTALFPLVVADIFAHVRPEDRDYFRQSREKRLGAPLEQAQESARQSRLPAFRATLEPARRLLGEQPFLAGPAPAYPDYILAGTMMWVRTVCSIVLLEPGDPILAWQDRMLDLFDGFARRAPAAAA